jgi:hypothetical protein
MTRIARTTTVVLVAGATALLVGCSSGASSPLATGGTTGAGTPRSSAISAPTAGSTVTATETEYSIALSTTTFAPGMYTFTIQNRESCRTV